VRPLNFLYCISGSPKFWVRVGIQSKTTKFRSILLLSVYKRKFRNQCVHLSSLWTVCVKTRSAWALAFSTTPGLNDDKSIMGMGTSLVCHWLESSHQSQPIPFHGSVAWEQMKWMCKKWNQVPFNEWANWWVSVQGGYVLLIYFCCGIILTEYDKLINLAVFRFVFMYIIYMNILTLSQYVSCK
jgi:hypothetical protein